MLLKFAGDLRQTYRTVAQEAGVGEVDISLLMNHKLAGVNANYITRRALLDHLIDQQERITSGILKRLRGDAERER